MVVDLSVKTIVARKSNISNCYQNAEKKYCQHRTLNPTKFPSNKRGKYTHFLQKMINMLYKGKDIN